jgi:hypothetical protein
LTTSNNQEAVAVKTRVNAGALTTNHNETVAVKTRVKAGDPQFGLPTGVTHGIIAVL